MLTQLIDIIGCRSRNHPLVGQPDDCIADRTVAVDAPAMQRAPGQAHRADFEARHLVPRRDMIERRPGDGRHNVKDHLVGHEAGFVRGWHIEPVPEHSQLASRRAGRR